MQVVAACVSGCGVCTEWCAACDSSRTLHTTQYTHHNLKHMLPQPALLITMYFYWLFLQKCNFSQAQCKFPEDDPNGPKHIETNITYFYVNFNILYV